MEIVIVWDWFSYIFGVLSVPILLILYIIFKVVLLNINKNYKKISKKKF